MYWEPWQDLVELSMKELFTTSFPEGMKGEIYLMTMKTFFPFLKPWETCLSKNEIMRDKQL